MSQREHGKVECGMQNVAASISSFSYLFFIAQWP
jgi:hypothetical protein